MPSSTLQEFEATITKARNQGHAVVVVPIGIRVLDDQLTPVLAYRRLVSADDRTAPSFLLESVEGGTHQGRHSILGRSPIIELIARSQSVTIEDHRTQQTTTEPCQDPLAKVREISNGWHLSVPDQATDEGLLPSCVLGGWFGYAGYDSVRYAEPVKLSLDNAPPDDRNLPEVSFGFYDTLVIFDHVDKLVHLVRLAIVHSDDNSDDNPETIYTKTLQDLQKLAGKIQHHAKPLKLGRVARTPAASNQAMSANTSRDEHAAMIEKAREYIKAGDVFQVVLGHRFERRTSADPFDVYRSLRAINPSPYMVYLQTSGCILVASSPEILCRVRRNNQGALVVTNRPLAGTRKRGRTPEEDLALEKELLADAKERSEHSMLVDLGRNDVGRVAVPGSIKLDSIMDIERYSHVMHISSTVTGTLRDGLDCWDALRAALPVGTISGAPKVRAMQIIDELEKVRRGPYGGGLGWVGLNHEMDIALALRTIVVPIDRMTGRTTDRIDESHPDGKWEYHIQAAGGIVADSVSELEFDETVNKAAALGRAIDLAEDAFANKPSPD